MGINEGHKNILHIALPAIVSNITVPLLGLVDVAIVGHLGAPAYIGAIAVGGMLFNIFYWIFAFLRMGTSGMTSQAYGRRDLDEVTRLLVRSVGVGFSVAWHSSLSRPRPKSSGWPRSISVYASGVLLLFLVFMPFRVGLSVCRIPGFPCGLP